LLSASIASAWATRTVFRGQAATALATGVAALTGFVRAMVVAVGVARD
jgi:hypothetical protein